MERLIGRKKIEEIRKAQKVELVQITDSENPFIMEIVPNFYIENLGCLIKDFAPITEEILHDEALVKLLNFFNEFCPAAHFEFNSSPINKHLNVYFGNVYLEIRIPSSYKEKSELDVKLVNKRSSQLKFSGNLDKFDLNRFRKTNYFKENSEYAVLDKEIRNIYNI